MVGIYCEKFILIPSSYCHQIARLPSKIPVETNFTLHQPTDVSITITKQVHSVYIGLSCTAFSPNLKLQVTSPINAGSNRPYDNCNAKVQYDCFNLTRMVVINETRLNNQKRQGLSISCAEELKIFAKIFLSCRKAGCQNR